MSHTKLYTAIFVVLGVIATVQVGVESMGLLEHGTYWLGFWLIMVLSAVKAVLVAVYYQHLRWEPRYVSYMAGAGVLAALALTTAATVSMI